MFDEIFVRKQKPYRRNHIREKLVSSKKTGKNRFYFFSIFCNFIAHDVDFVGDILRPNGYIQLARGFMQ